MAEIKDEAPAVAQGIKVRVLRDFWGDPNPDNMENRTRAGSIIEVSIDEAFAGIEAGMFERHKGD